LLHYAIHRGQTQTCSFADSFSRKEKIKDAESDFDLLQREYKLDQDSFYSSTDYARNTSAKEKLDAMKQQISGKQQELEQLLHAHLLCCLGRELKSYAFLHL